MSDLNTGGKFTSEPYNPKSQVGSTLAWLKGRRSHAKGQVDAYVKAGLESPKQYWQGRFDAFDIAIQEIEADKRLDIKSY